MVHKIKAYVRKTGKQIVNNLNIKSDINNPKLCCAACKKDYKTRSAYVYHLEIIHCLSFINEVTAMHGNTIPMLIPITNALDVKKNPLY